MRSPAFAKIRPPPPSEPGLDDHDRMRITGLEPARLLTIEPKSIASANSAISAKVFGCVSSYHFAGLLSMFIKAGIGKHREKFGSGVYRLEWIVIYWMDLRCIVIALECGKEGTPDE